MSTDNLNKWEATNEDEKEKQKEHNDEDEKNKNGADHIKLKKKCLNWHIISEVINRQIGSNPLFERRLYSSLYTVEELQLMYKLYPSVTVKYSFCKCIFNYPRFIHCIESSIKLFSYHYLMVCIYIRLLFIA